MGRRRDHPNAGHVIETRPQQRSLRPGTSATASVQGDLPRSHNRTQPVEALGARRGTKLAAPQE